MPPEIKVRVVCVTNAGIAQLVEQLICNQQVIGSSPIAGSTSNSLLEWILRLHKNFQLAATGQLTAHLLPKIQSVQPNPEPHRAYGRRLFWRSCEAISGKAAFSDPQAVRVGILR